MNKSSRILVYCGIWKGVTNYMHDIIMACITATIPVLIALFGAFLSKYVKTSSNMEALFNLVDAGVVFAERMGVIKNLTGSEQFQEAYNFVQAQLKKMGITNTDEELIKSLIERSWAKQKDLLDHISNGTNTEVKEKELADQEADIKKQEAQLQVDKEHVEAQKAQLKSVIGDIDNTLQEASTATQATKKPSDTVSASTNSTTDTADAGK